MKKRETEITGENKKGKRKGKKIRKVKRRKIRIGGKMS